MGPFSRILIGGTGEQILRRLAGHYHGKAGDDDLCKSSSSEPVSTSRVIVSAGGNGGGGDGHLPHQHDVAPAGDLAMRGTSERPAAEVCNIFRWLS